MIPVWKRADRSTLQVSTRCTAGLLEDMIGVRLQPDQRIIIGVSEAALPVPDSTPRRAQTLDDWRAVYEGLSESQIEEIDRIANTRADLTRELP